ncbi:MAG TPA: addiction module protein [Flavobacteriales bacterium]|jgi:putative addiction module component (TIGR02574 family)|nr:addiction module protein [Flavobacteriales bacterium]
MDIQAEKLDLIKWITQLNDLKVINEIKALRKEKAESIVLSSVHKAILDERIASHEANPESGSTWKEVRQRITSR